MVMFLIVFFWDKDNVQSTYRYVLNTFYLTLIPITMSLEQILDNESKQSK